MSVIKFGAWQDLSGNEVANSSDPVGDGGLVLIKSQTIGTAVSSVTVSDVFSSAFDNYLITLNGGTMSSDTTLKMQLGSLTTGYYQTVIFSSFAGAGVSTDQYSNSSSWIYGGGGGARPTSYITLFNPYTTYNTQGQARVRYSTVYGQSQLYVDDEGTSHSSFTFIPYTGTISGSVIRVYGYRN